MIAKLIGRILRKPAVHERLLRIAARTPDQHIASSDGTDVYMYRYWLFNRITNYKRRYWFIPFSIRIHHIVRPDSDRHLHDHPFNARTWIMRGGYEEVRLHELFNGCARITGNVDRLPMYEIQRFPGDTSTLGFEQYHKITKVADCGALTLFMFGRYRGDWGFLVNGCKMLRREYQRRFDPHAPGACLATQYSETTICYPCGLGWDTNDEHRPPCGDPSTEPSP
jgi:hypothetical protein